MLLSIYQTCRYKGVSFLKFLLSGRRTSTCSARAAQKREPAAIETYPEGFVPHFKQWQTPKQAGESGVAQEHAAPDEQGPAVFLGG